MKLSDLLRPRAYARSEHSETACTQKGSSGKPLEHPLGLRPRIKHAVFAREVDFNAFVPGLGGSVERPVRVSPEPSKVEVPTDETSRLQTLSEQAKGLPEQLPVKSPSPWQRPARTKLSQLATSIVPWLKPRPLREKATVHERPTWPETAGQASALGSDLAAALRHCEDADAVLRIAREQQQAMRLARQQADGSVALLLEEQRAGRAVAAAEARQAQALKALRHLTGAAGLQHLAANALAQQLLVDKERFMLERLDDTKRQLHGARTPAVDHLRRLHETEQRLSALRTDTGRSRPAVDLAREDHAKLQHAVEQARGSLREARSDTPATTEAQVRLTRLRTLQPQATGQHRQPPREVAGLQATATNASCEHEALKAEARQARRRLQVTDSGLSAVLKASIELSRSPLDATAAQSIFERRQAQALQVQAGRPRGFEAGEASRQFGLQLLQTVRRRPHNLSADALPSIGVMEIASDMMAAVCGEDAERAQRLLHALQSLPARRWMEDVADLADGGAEIEPTAAESDVRNLLRLASMVPRGVEVVHLLGDPADAVPSGDALQAMRSFWSADAAQRAETDRDVRRWLAGAKRAARLRWSGEDIDGLPEAQKAAYNAVRNGCLSNAASTPYARHDERMRKAMDEWIVREQPAASRAQRVLVPNRRKSPFTASGLKRAMTIAESFGMVTSRRLADDGVQQAAGRLADWAGTDLARDLGAAGIDVREARAFAAATQVLAERAQRHEHASQWRLDSHEAAALRAVAFDHKHRTAAHPRRLQKPNRHHALPPLFEELAAGKADALEALRAVADWLKLTFADAVPDGRDEALAQDAAVHEANDIARQKHFRSKEDVVRYFEPILLRMQLRDKLKLSGGGVMGGGLPSLPYSVPSPVVSPVFSAGWSRKDEAFFQVFMPILGMEISLGGLRATGPEATVGVAAGPNLPGLAKLQVSATEKLSRQELHTEGTILRLLRQRGRDGEMRIEMLGILDSWVRWDQVHPPGSPPYSGPLEAVLARHPQVSLGEIEGSSLTRSFLSKVSAGANLKLHGIDGHTYKLGVAGAASLKTERIAEFRTEHGGHVSVKSDKGDTAQQKFSLGLQVNSLTPANPSEVPLGPGGSRGGVSGGGVPGQLDLSRDLYWNLEKHSVSPFTIGGKQDADLDRHYSTPKDMLAEIRRHRVDWLARCVETLEPGAHGNKDTPANRQLAEALLRSFEARVEELGRNSRLCQYNVNYSMRPQASAWIDTFRALEGLAVLRGDAQAASEARAASDRAMQQDSTWRPLMLIVREKGRDVRTYGWNFGLRLQRSIGVEGQRTAAQFPPP